MVGAFPKEGAYGSKAIAKSTPHFGESPPQPIGLYPHKGMRQRIS